MLDDVVFLLVERLRMQQKAPDSAGEKDKSIEWQEMKN